MKMIAHIIYNWSYVHCWMACSEYLNFNFLSVKRNFNFSDDKNVIAQVYGIQISIIVNSILSSTIYIASCS